MLALKVLSTVFLSISVITMLLKNVMFFDTIGRELKLKAVIVFSLYGLLWRTLLMVTLWIAL